MRADHSYDIPPLGEGATIGIGLYFILLSDSAEDSESLPPKGRTGCKSKPDEGGNMPVPTAS